MEKYEELCRKEIVNLNEKKFLMSQIGLSKEDQKRLNCNCEGFGRIRKFKRKDYLDWNSDPIPIDLIPNTFKLDSNEIAVQMFEVAKCNVNCWWCYLPDELKKNKEKYTKWYSISELLDIWEKEKQRPQVIYMSGGNPELVPELIYETMRELERRGLSEETYLWSDDVLTTDFLFEKLSKEQIDYMVKYKNYGKVCCLKGFDDDTIKQNACIKEASFSKQIGRLKKYVDYGFDVYSYIVLTTEDMNDVEEKICECMDKLQEISYYMPLRMVPLRIEKFPTIVHRLNNKREQTINNQFEVLKLWNEQLRKRFTEDEINTKISELQIK